MIVARLIGGFCGGFIALGLASTSHSSASHQTAAAGVSPVWWLAVPIASALVAGVALSMVLPRLSSRTVAYAPAITATTLGGAIPVVLTLLSSHRLGGTTPLIAAAGWLVGVTMTTLLVRGASTPIEA